MNNYIDIISKHTRIPHRPPRHVSESDIKDQSKDKNEILPKMPATRQVQSSFIAQSQRRVASSEQALVRDNKAHIKLDGQYGDYRMNIFRVKDRNRWMRDVPTLFTNEFRAKIIDCFPRGTLNDRSLSQFIERERLRKIEPKQIQQVKPPQPPNTSQLMEIQDNMNGYLSLKYYPELPTTRITNYQPGLTNSQHFLESPLPAAKKQYPSKHKQKGYMFPGLARLQGKKP